MSTRNIAAIFSMLLMLAGYVPESALFAPASDSCPPGHLCCRRAHRNGGQQHTGAQWQADPCGSPNCGSLPGTITAPFHGLAALSAGKNPVSFTGQFVAVPIARDGAAQYSLHLYQRPPPQSV